MSASSPPMAIIDDIRLDLQDAAANILSLSFTGMDLLRRPVTDLNALERVFTGLLEASCFQDLTGQKLDQVEALLTGRADHRTDSELLNGPAQGRTGLDQAAADLLFASPDR